MYRLEIADYAKSIIAKQNPKNQRLLQSKLEDLEQGNFSGDKALKGRHKGKFRKRAGDFRIIYLKSEEVLLVCVIHIEHRKDIYKD